MTSAEEIGQITFFSEADVVIDSLRLSFFHEFPINKDLITECFPPSDWQHHQKLSKGGEVNEWFELWGNNLPTYTHLEYFPDCIYTRKPLLKVHIGSIQIINSGSNVDTCTNIETLCQSLTSYLRAFPGLENIDASQGLVRLIDLCVYHQLGANLDPLMAILMNKRIPRRIFNSYDNPTKLKHKEDTLGLGTKINGVSYGNKSITLSFYKKLEESGDPRAVGMLRQEVRLVGLKTIEARTGLRNPTLKDITPEIAKRVLTYQLNLLDIDRDIPTMLTVRNQLLNKYGPKDGHDLFNDFDILQEVKSLKRCEIKQKTGYSVSSIDRIKRKLKAAGVPRDLSPLNYTIPGLQVKFEDELCIFDNELLSDTRDSDLCRGDSRIENAKELQPISHPPSDFLKKVEQTNAELKVGLALQDDIREKYGFLTQKDNSLPEILAIENTKKEVVLMP